MDHTRLTAVAVVLGVTGSMAPAAAAPSPPPLTPPVDAPIERRFDAPSSRYGPGHRGIDYRVAVGTDVRAAQSGVVRFAGRVADVLAVTIDHGTGLESTYTILSGLRVREGDHVDQGQWIGKSGASHPGRAGGLHFGTRLRGRYVDPETLLVDADVSRAIHLAPLAGGSDGDAAEGARAADPGMGRRGDAGPRCAPVTAPRRRPPAPNDNVAVAIAGIGSRTAGGAPPELYDGYLTDVLGYSQGHTYAFSYRGMRGPRLHRGYRRGDTEGDLRIASDRLATMLERIAVRHPDARVDLIAHSQGGVLARAYLQSRAEWDYGQPTVEHLVTFAGPHRGTTLAEVPDDLARDTITGGLLTRGISALSKRGWIPLPDPHSKAVRQMEPDSSFIASLADEDLVYGTRALSLATPHDLVVPAHMAALPDERNHVVPPRGLWGHEALLDARESRALAYSFLRDGRDACRGLSDVLGPAAGRVVAEGHRKVSEVYEEAEDRAVDALLRGLGDLARKVLDRLRGPASRAWGRLRTAASRALGALRT